MCGSEASTSTQRYPPSSVCRNLQVHHKKVEIKSRYKLDWILQRKKERKGKKERDMNQ